MGCRIGMSTDVEARVDTLKAEETVPQSVECTILESGLTYDQATKLEKKLREECGPNCDGDVGGKRVEGKQWDVYRLEWEN